MKRPNFDRIARPYRWLEYLSFGPALTHCRNHFLPQLHDRRGALVFGDGDGRFLARLLAANLRLRADAVDLSPAMLRLLSTRAKAPARLRTLCTSAQEFRPESDATYDLVVTHFFLDCLTQAEVEELLARITPHLAPGALWVVSEFHVPCGPLHWPARGLIRSLYLGFRIITGLRTARIPNYASALASIGLVRISTRVTLGGILISELWRYPPSDERAYSPRMQLPPQKPHVTIPDPVPDPEPASPSLPEPDPGIYHPHPEPPSPPASPM